MATDQAITDPVTTPEPSSDGPGSASFPLPAGTTATDFAETPATSTETPETPETPETSTEPESPAVTIPFTVPDALRTPEPTTQGGMSEAEQEQLLARNETLERQHEEAQQAQSQNQQSVSIQDRTQGYLNTLQLENLTADQIARWAATEVEKAISDGRTNTQQAERQGSNDRKRRETAESVGKAFNVNPADLMKQNSKASMEERAEWIVELNKTRTDISALQRTKVPDQEFIDGGHGAGGGGRFTAQQLEDMSPQDYEKNRDRILGITRS